MSFNIGLSGMRAASKDLNVTGNNIANAGTAGFKQSRAEFADVYASSMGVNKNSVGSGVQLANISQQFTQGNVNYTGNALDLAVNGKGFFQVSNNGAMSYTRAGYFGTDRQGYLVDNFGYNLQGYMTDANGTLGDTVGNLRIQSGSQEPKPTSKLDQVFNLNSTSTTPTTAPFNAADPATYNSSTSTNIYDSQGNAHVLTQYFIKQPSPANTWAMNVLVDGRNPSGPLGDPASVDLAERAASSANTAQGVFDAVNAGSPHPAVLAAATAALGSVDPAPTADTVLQAVRRASESLATAPFTATLAFSSAGKLLSSTSADFSFNEDGTMALTNWNPAASDGGSPAVWADNGADASADGITLDFRNASQYSSAFAVTSVSQDGYTTGELAGLEIDETGQIFARYTNGQSKVQGQVVLASFANEQGLTPVGKTQWVQSFESGDPVRNPPGVGTMGALQAGALEDSNVELSDQLVNLIVAQRNYQANAKTIETESAITQTIINLR
ncbi:flagellar hook protein FlgE [Pseudomonas stutzeri]|uniref:flagellar hook protein FlgE n=1 Tax=Stutzerimonas stutzeri TaxID=316 RepID=UPI00210EA355|nr:flagellar hook protein FlgE [Stutzerimonas stutzeri]MCQ4307702.1 flagellar hook protein FlgE [Stutzerimonas stutzeri]